MQDVPARCLFPEPHSKSVTITSVLLQCGPILARPHMAVNGTRASLHAGSLPYSSRSGIPGSGTLCGHPVRRTWT